VKQSREKTQAEDRSGWIATALKRLAMTRAQFISARMGIAPADNASPAVRQKRSKLAPTSRQASSTFAVGVTAANVVGVFMALLSFRQAFAMWRLDDPGLFPLSLSV
jgi:hypothetical protein